MSTRLYRKAKIAAHDLLSAVSDRETFAAHPEAAVRNQGIAIVNRQVSGGECSIAATYDQGPPPTIAVTPSLSLGRRHFSILHEYGHHLITNSWPATTVIAEFHGQDARYVEEAICDVVAAELLLPDPLVGRIGPKGPSASDVIALFYASQASREACCVKAAQTMRTPGYVMLADLTGTALFTAAASTAYRVRRGTAQPANGAIARAGRSGSFRGTDSVQFSTGNQSPLHHVDARRDGDYVFGVFCIDTPPWETLSLGSPDSGDWPADELVCEHCEFAGTARGPFCRLCGQPRCPQCNNCGFDIDLRRCRGDFATE